MPQAPTIPPTATAAGATSPAARGAGTRMPRRTAALLDSVRRDPDTPGRLRAAGAERFARRKRGQSQFPSLTLQRAMSSNLGKLTLTHFSCLTSLWQEFQQASIAMKRLGDIMDAPPEPQSLTPSRAPEGKGEVRVRNLVFRYSPDHPYLFQHLNLTLAPGKLTVLTGPSGSGRSTLAKLILGFYQPEDGRIAIDERDIRHFSANELRQHFGVVPQETVLFSGSIYENLLAANPNAAFGDIVQAAKIAEVHDTIEKLPKGYNTEIGEHGAGLSGGQKQRLAIARAVLKRPKILIFDEATSALDQQTAERFAQTVNKLKGVATILFIAHQLPKGLAVDEVFSLSSEKVTQAKVIDEERP
ncbi:MAG: ATP-binding cassette domain-containing protein [Burkholderiales bacterium]|nr:ATP-binding cassette domain-containing protein [Burkholderiales bacterium]